MSVSGDILSHEALSFLCNCINNTVNLSKDIVLDTAIQTSSTYSSFLIENKLKQLKEENETYANSLVAGLNKLSKEVINDKSLVTQENILYLYKSDDDTSNNYMQMMLINGVSVELGTTEVDISTLYSKDECDSKFGAKLDLDTLTTSFNDLKTTLGNEALTTTAQTLKGGINEVNTNKANASEVVKKTDITTTIDSTSTDDTVPTSKAVETRILKREIIKNVDLNTFVDEGKYYIASGCTNSPIDGGYLNIMRYNDDFVCQICARYHVSTSKNMYIRTKVSGTWKEWRSVCVTSVEDVPATQVNYNVSDIKSGKITYEVINGVCYVYIIGLVPARVGLAIEISQTSMPKPRVGLVTCSINNDAANERIGLFYIDHGYNCCPRVHFYSADKAGYATFSYPVAES